MRIGTPASATYNGSAPGSAAAFRLTLLPSDLYAAAVDFVYARPRALSRRGAQAIAVATAKAIVSRTIVMMPAQHALNARRRSLGVVTNPARA